MAQYKRAGTLFPDLDEDSEQETSSSGPNFGGTGGGSKNGSLSKSRVDKAKGEVKGGSGWGQGQDEDHGFNINSNYAQRYDKWRNKEELMKMKARYGTDNIEDLERQQNEEESEDSSSSEEEWTEEKEKAFFKTLSNLKKKDPKIYDPSVRFFTPEEEEAAKSKESSPPGKMSPKKSSSQKKADSKPFLLKDHERTMILEKGGLISDSEEEEENKDKMINPPSTLSYYQELDSIKKGFSAALEGIQSDDEDGAEEQLLLKRGKPKTQEERKQEDEDYRLWLKGELKRLDNGKLSKDEVKELSFLRSYWNDEKLDEGEKFLRDYILNRKYVEGDEKGLKSVFDDAEEDEESSYNKIAHDSDEEGLSNDEQFEEKREEFEHKYNFRFEEPDPEFIKRFPRTIEDSLRREDESRKRQRESAKERKQDAKERKREEVQRLKAYKRKEILEKLQQLQDISGNPDLRLDEMDIDGDFDPEEYDAKMGIAFNDQYYTDSVAVDEDKPVFPYDPEIDDEADWKEWVPSNDEDDEEIGGDGESTKSLKKIKKKSKKAQPEKEGQMSQNPGPSSAASTSKFSLAEELIEISKGRKSNKKSKSNIFLEALEKNKPKFNPSVHKSFDQYFKEYYALDFEDLIGDLPCRFKYRKVAPNDFGLSTSEILKAEDRELNQWASLKKTYQYRAEEEEKYETQAYKKKAENEGLKKRVLLSVYQPTSAEGDDDENEDEESAELNEDNPVNGNETSIANKAKKKKKKDKKKNKSKASTAKDMNEQSETEVKVEMDDVPSDDNETIITPKKSKSVRPIESIEIKDEPEEVEEDLEPSTMVDETEPEILNQDEPEATTPKLSKRQRKNKKKQNPSDPNKVITSPTTKNSTPKQDQNSQKKKKNNFKNQSSSFSNGSKPASSNIGSSNKRKAEVTVEDERLKAYGINPKKHKKWVKYGGNNQE